MMLTRAKEIMLHKERIAQNFNDRLGTYYKASDIRYADGTYFVPVDPNYPTDEEWRIIDRLVESARKAGIDILIWTELFPLG